MSEEKKNGSTSNSYNQPPPLFVRLDGRLIRSRVPLTYYDGSFKLSSYLQHSSTSFKRLDFSSQTRPAGEKERFVFFPFLLSPFSCAALDKNIQGSNVSWQPLWYIEGEWKQGSPALVRDTDGVKQKWQQLSKDCRRTGSKERIGGGVGGEKRKKHNTGNVRCIKMTRGASASLSGTPRGRKSLAVQTPTLLCSSCHFFYFFLSTWTCDFSLKGNKCSVVTSVHQHLLTSEVFDVVAVR